MGWTDYGIAVDVHFQTTAPATVMGRIDGTDVLPAGNARWPAGYILRLKPDGAWELRSAVFKKPMVTLAAGSATIDKTQWHHLELRFHGGQIQATLDGVVLASVEDETHAHGMFAIGTEWDRIEFDNLRVTP